MSNPLLKPAAKLSYIGGLLGAGLLVFILVTIAWPAIIAALPANTYAIGGITLYQWLFYFVLSSCVLLGFSIGQRYIH